MNPRIEFLKVAVSNFKVLLQNISLTNLKRLFYALRNEPPVVILHNLKNYINIQKRREKFANTSNKKVELLEQKYPGITEPIGLANIYVLETKFKPIPFEIDNNEGIKVNILLPQLDPSIMFGGYISCFEFIAALVNNDKQVRILICEMPDFDLNEVLEKLSSNEHLHSALSKCEFENVSAKDTALKITTADSFVAYSFWTGILAHQLALGIGKKFIFFIQEYEPIFHSRDSFHAIGNYVYGLPHFAIFNTEILRDYFKENKLGVFSESEQKGIENSCYYQHALTKTQIPTIDELKRRKKKRFLFYGRPENHAKRNLFEIALIGLKTAVFSGVFDDEEWEFVGVGTLGTEHEIELGNGHQLTLISKMSHSDYAKALSEFDLGLSLMYAPHPSILPFEMASSGLVTVTNTYANRTSELLTSISENIEPCAPDIDSVAEAIKSAVARVDNFEDRVANAHIKWVDDWSKSFNPGVISRISEFLEEKP